MDGGGYGLGNVITLLENLGVFQYFLPFLLIFAIIFGILERTEVFGKGRKDINATVALSMAFIAVAAAWVTNAIRIFSEVAGVAAIAIVCLLMLSTLIAGEQTQLPKWLKYAGMVGVVFTILYVIAELAGIPLFRALGEVGAAIGIPLGDVLAISFFLIIFIAAIAIIIREKPEGER
ncbi:MAG: hypothetical protein QW507_02525 [Candidatus Nanoarchaeia archaeon]|nr:hypothetical protein [Candidatus Haiyanarchaeum thermophilum]MCW1303297.1 hypothetical protein [Candidatus Haiyanarchaeum thermophilum]MCW1303971.1 hypothetical protein [Candidatus Haiyanarchaeum thermophilum]MCW1306456.1 hypothetical protein [Candidatus Haiyanarchaeum thermophilum]MCW1307246.1 hypothetical protein [Candidatus Haiyanarchaeum thermophilum]